MQYVTYLIDLFDLKINDEKVSVLEDAYKCNLSPMVKRIISNCDEPIFLDEDRVMSYNEIKYASEDLEFDFNKINCMPIIDCGSNYYILYNFKDKKWCSFCLADETVFNQFNTLKELMDKRYL